MTSPQHHGVAGLLAATGLVRPRCAGLEVQARASAVLRAG